jgi:hypothetical protein
MAFGLLLPLRIAQFVFSVIILGLAGYGTLWIGRRWTFADSSAVAHWYNADTLTASPNQINFLIFVPIFSLISIAYLELIPRFLAKGRFFTPLESKEKN